MIFPIVDGYLAEGIDSGSYTIDSSLFAVLEGPDDFDIVRAVNDFEKLYYPDRERPSYRDSSSDSWYDEVKENADKLVKQLGAESLKEALVNYLVRERGLKQHSFHPVQFEG